MTTMNITPDSDVTKINDKKKKKKKKKNRIIVVISILVVMLLMWYHIMTILYPFLFFKTICCECNDI